MVPHRAVRPSLSVSSCKALCFALTSALVFPASAHAGEQAPARPCAERHTTALGQIACELGSGLPTDARATLVLATPVKTSLHAERLDQLAARLASLLAGELGSQARAAERPIAVSNLWQPAESGTRRIVVHSELHGDRFVATADVLGARPLFWERLRGVAPGSLAHAFSSRPLDAELQSHLPPIPLVVTRVDKSGPLSEPSVAIACGDVNADGSMQIVSVGRQRVSLGRIAQGRFVVTRSLLWSDLADIAPTPLRQPIASAVVPAPGTLEVGISDRSAAVRLDHTLRVIARYPRRIPWPGGGCASVGSVGLSPERSACRTERPSSGPPSENIDAIAGANLVRPDGTALPLLARRRQRDSRLELELGSRALEFAEPVGAQLALGDLNGDGLPELVSSHATLDPGADFLRVHTLREQGPLEEAFRIPVPSGIHAIGLCPRQSDGLSPVVLATGEGLWVLR